MADERLVNLQRTNLSDKFAWPGGEQILAVALAGATFLAATSLSHGYDWEPPPEKTAILVVNSHPDDEGIFFGGVLPYYSRVLNVPTMLLSLTSGDWNPANLLVREEELRCAAWTYGLKYEPLFPRFKDVPSHSMANNPYTNKIDATWDYWADGVLQGDGSDVEAGKAKAIYYVAEQIRRFRPDVVVTHDFKGEYGHDNHRATSWVVTNAFFVAADPSVTATNVAPLPPWQVSKLYLHLYPTNRLFHRFTEVPFLNLTNRTARQTTDLGLDCHVSQGRPDVSTVYRTGENFDPYPSEWWGLYASTVGLDTVLTNDVIFNGYLVTNGAAAGNFLEHLAGFTNEVNDPPSFVADPLMLADAGQDQAYVNQSLAVWATDPDLAWGDQISFSKVSGPDWLTVAADGALGGTPSAGDLGTNTFIVRTTDLAGLQAETTLVIQVIERIWALDYLVGWWKLDESGGETAADSAPPEQNGVLFSGVTPGQAGVNAHMGGSFLFDGTTNGKVDVAYSTELNPSVFTVATWAKVLGGIGTYRSPVTSRRDGTQSGYVFYAGNNNNWQFWIGTGSGWRNLSGGPVITNTWVHLAGTYDGTTLRFYTNGVLAAAAPNSFRPNDLFPLRIGAGASEGPGQYWVPGFVDDVRVYQTALTASQIWALFANTPPAFAEDPLLREEAIARRFYAGSTLANSASDADAGDAVRLSKISGPAWLSVAADGSISGMPSTADIGLNIFGIRVTDDQGASDEAELRIRVQPPPTPPAFVGIERLSNAVMQLQATGGVGQAYVLWTARRLGPAEAWLAVATNSADATGAVFFLDPGATNYESRFYRLATP